MPTSNVKIAELPAYRDTIIAAIKANQGMRKERLAAVLSRDYSLPVHWKALDTFCRRENLWSIRPDAITPSRVLKGKRTAAEAFGYGQDDCWSYTLEIKSILEANPDAGGRAVATALSDQNDIHLCRTTLTRWLQKHRAALLDGTLERPILYDDALPEDHSDKIDAILKKEPLAGRWRVLTELRRLYGVSIPEKRL